MPQFEQFMTEDFLRYSAECGAWQALLVPRKPCPACGQAISALG